MTSRRVSNFVFSFDSLAIAYLVISILVARMCPDTIVIVVATSASIILIPMLVGKSIISLIYRKQGNTPNGSKIASAAVAWFTGNLVIYYSASILSFAKLLDPYLFSFSLILLPGAYLIINSLRKSNKRLNDSLQDCIDRTFGNKIVVPFIFLAGLLPLLYILPVQPFPLSSTGNLARIGCSFDFMNKGYIELVGGYANWISVILGILSAIYNFHPLQILSATNYISHIVYPFALYLISYKITKDEKISLIPAFVGPWIILEGSLNLTELTNTPLTFHIFTWMLYIALNYYDSSSLSLRGLSVRSFLLPLLIILLSPITYILGRGGRVIAPPYAVFLSLILPMILLVIYYTLNRNCEPRIKTLVIFIFPLTLVAIAHPFLGIMVIFFLACFLLTLSISPRHLRKLRISTLTLLAIVLILIVSQVNFSSNLILSRLLFGDLLSGGGADINIQQKWLIFLWQGPEVAVFLYFLSVILISVFGDRKFIPFAFTSSVILFVTLSPEGSFYRVAAYLNPLAAIMLSYLLLLPVNMIERKEKKEPFSNIMPTIRQKCSSIKFRGHTLKPKTLYVITVLVLILPSIQVARKKYVENFLDNSGEGYWSYIQTYDVEFSLWIRDNFRNERILIISDPATMFYLGSLTGKETLMTEYIYFLQHEYSNETWIRMEQLKQKVFLSSREEDPSNAIHEILSSTSTPFETNYNRVFLVITPRTYSWLYKNSTFPIVAKLSTLDSTIFSKFNNNKFFNFIYRVPKALYVYEIKLQEYKL
jgi:hypothetical protein